MVTTGMSQECGTLKCSIHGGIIICVFETLSLNFFRQRLGDDSLEDWEYVNPCHSNIKSNRMVIIKKQCYC